jgi:Co/Zn/Cd efflux system component
MISIKVHYNVISFHKPHVSSHKQNYIVLHIHYCALPSSQENEGALKMGVKKIHKLKFNVK